MPMNWTAKRKYEVDYEVADSEGANAVGAQGDFHAGRYLLLKRNGSSYTIEGGSDSLMEVVRAYSNARKELYLERHRNSKK